MRPILRHRPPMSVKVETRVTLEVAIALQLDQVRSAVHNSGGRPVVEYGVGKPAPNPLKLLQCG